MTLDLPATARIIAKALTSRDALLSPADVVYLSDTLNDLADEVERLQGLHEKEGQA